jgi:hypothetical protein
MDDTFLHHSDVPKLRHQLKTGQVLFFKTYEMDNGKVKAVDVYLENDTRASRASTAQYFDRNDQTVRIHGQGSSSLLKEPSPSDTQTNCTQQK